MSLWGGAVITNFFYIVPNLIELFSYFMVALDMWIIASLFLVFWILSLWLHIPVWVMYAGFLLYI